MKVGDLFVSLGLKVDKTKIDQVNASFKTMRTNLRDVTLGFIGAVYSLDRFVQGAVDGVAALRSLNSQTGLSIDKIQKWQQAGQLSSLALTADSVANSIGNLQKNLTEIKLGGGDVSPFTMLGIDVYGKDAFTVLEEMRERIKGIAPDVAANLVSRTGLDANFLSILRLSNAEFEKLGRNNFLSEKGRNAVNSVGLAIKQLKINLSQMRDNVVARLAPQLNKLISEFFAWLIKNQSKIVGAISAFVKAFVGFITMISRAVALLKDFAENVLGAQNGLKALGLALGAIFLSFRPFFLILFAIIGLFEDIAVWKAGGQSAFGGIYESIANLFKKLEGAKDSLLKFKDLIKEAFTLDEETKKNMGLLAKVFDFVGQLGGNVIKGAIGGLLIGGVPGAIAGGMAGAGFTGIQKFIDLSKQAEKEGYVRKRADGKLVSQEEYEDFNRKKAEGKNFTQTNNIYIQGGENPREIAREVDRQIKDTYSAQGANAS